MALLSIAQKRDNVMATNEPVTVPPEQKTAPSAALLTDWSIRQEEQRLRDWLMAVDATTATLLRARHQLITNRIEELATTYAQVVLLGGGSDTRPLWLSTFCLGDIHIFEVDVYTALAQKLYMLRQWRLPLPMGSQHVPIALNDPQLPHHLQRAGFVGARPTLLIIESLFYLLPPTTTACFLAPAWLPLAPASKVLFDCWSPARVQTFNAYSKAYSAAAPFYPPPLPSQPAQIQQILAQIGYGLVQITPLAQALFPPAQLQRTGEQLHDWLLIEATVR